MNVLKHSYRQDAVARCGPEGEPLQVRSDENRTAAKGSTSVAQERQGSIAQDRFVETFEIAGRQTPVAASQVKDPAPERRQHLREKMPLKCVQTTQVGVLPEPLILDALVEGIALLGWGNPSGNPFAMMPPLWFGRQGCCTPDQGFRTTPRLRGQRVAGGVAGAGFAIGRGRGERGVATRWVS
jgi:hypothetical protein